MRILIVDDSDKDRAFFRKVLSQAGHKDNAFAGSADEAFEILKPDDPMAEDPGVDLILMDIGMPGHDGIQALRRIHAAPHLKDIPVIMVTSEPKDENLIQAFESGAADFLAKPMNKVELVVRVGAALRLKKEIDRRKENEEKLRKANMRLERQSSLDGLTGAPNRRSFDTYLKQEWRRAIRSQSSICLIMADIDHFKDYNDTYGHQAGDECLKRVARALAGCLKRSGDMAARYGGEEFAIILPETNLAGALDLADRMREAVIHLGIVHATSPVSSVVTISLGVSGLIPKNGDHADDLVEQADLALYRAKGEGRNQVQGPSDPAQANTA